MKTKARTDENKSKNGGKLKQERRKPKARTEETKTGDSRLAPI
jgi:hypothetical protein